MNFGQAVTNEPEHIEEHPNEVWLRYSYDEMPLTYTLCTHCRMYVRTNDPFTRKHLTSKRNITSAFKFT